MVDDAIVIAYIIIKYMAQMIKKRILGYSDIIKDNTLFIVNPIVLIELV